MIHPTAIIGENVIIQEGVEIGPYCLIGMPAENKGTHGQKGKGVLIKSGTIITGHVTIDSGAYEPTVIGENCYLMKHSHVGHDAVIFDNVTISCGAKVGGHTIVMDYSNIGLNAVIHQKMIIPPGSMIGMGSVVPRKEMDKTFGVWAGNPVKYLRPNNYLIDKGLNTPELNSRYWNLLNNITW